MCLSRICDVFTQVIIQARKNKELEKQRERELEKKQQEEDEKKTKKAAELKYINKLIVSPAPSTPQQPNSSRPNTSKIRGTYTYYLINTFDEKVMYALWIYKFHMRSNIYVHYMQRTSQIMKWTDVKYRHGKCYID